MSGSYLWIYWSVWLKIKFVHLKISQTRHNRSRWVITIRKILIKKIKKSVYAWSRNSFKYNGYFHTSSLSSSNSKTVYNKNLYLRTFKHRFYLSHHHTFLWYVRCQFFIKHSKRGLSWIKRRGNLVSDV